MTPAEDGPSGAEVVVVTIPARDEETSILDCLFAVERAAHRAVQDGVVRLVLVRVVAHRCADRTHALAHAFLRESGLGRAIELAAGTGVGAARDLGARSGLATVRAPLRRTWIFSTDADTRVPDDWIVRGLDLATRAAATCVVGMAELDAWDGDEQSFAAYQRLITEKMYDDPTGLHQHGHVYGANLAVRADCYLQVGGFTHHGHGEDQRLVDTLESAGATVARSQPWTVVTSGRLVGRADGGLADVLHRMCTPQVVAGLGDVSASG